MNVQPNSSCWFCVYKLERLYKVFINSTAAFANGIVQNSTNWASTLYSKGANLLYNWRRGVKQGWQTTSQVIPPTIHCMAPDGKITRLFCSPLAQKPVSEKVGKKWDGTCFHSVMEKHLKILVSFLWFCDVSHVQAHQYNTHISKDKKQQQQKHTNNLRTKSKKKTRGFLWVKTEMQGTDSTMYSYWHSWSGGLSLGEPRYQLKWKVIEDLNLSAMWQWSTTTWGKKGRLLKDMLFSAQDTHKRLNFCKIYGSRWLYI